VGSGQDATQSRLAGRDALRSHAIVAEAALRLVVGGPAVMAAQLDQLITRVRARNITIQVVPSTSGHLAGVASNFTVLHFADPRTDPPFGYYDGPLGGHMINDEGDVASMITAFEDLRQSALKPADSTDLLTAILKEYQQRGG
jgi:hypothetical protein